jgi:hypothetical protein
MKNVSWMPQNLLDDLAAVNPNTIEAQTEESSETTAANLATDDLGQIWRSLAAGQFSSSIKFRVSSGNLRQVGAVAIGASNLWTAGFNEDTGVLTPTARWRVRVATDIFEAYPKPSGIDAMSGNLSGVVASLRDPDPFVSADSTWVTCTNNAGNDIRVSMDLAGSELMLKTGAGQQRFVARVRRKAAGGTNPTLAVELWENGVFRTSIATGIAVTSAAGQVIDLTFNSASLVDQSGAEMEFKLIATAGSTTTVEYGSIGAALEFQDGGGNTIYDSGQLTPALPSVLGRTPLHLIHALPASMSCLQAQIDFLDSNNLDGFIEAGYLHIGPLVTTEINVAYGCAWGFADPSVKSTTPGGRVMAEERPIYRVFQGSFEFLRKTEALDKLLDQLDRRVGTTRLMVLIQDTDDPTQFHNTAGIGRLLSLSPAPLARFQRYTKQIDFEEAVA